MSRASQKVSIALFGADWDIGTARERVDLIAAKRHRWKKPRAVVIEAIDSAIENLKAARKAAAKL